MKFSSPVHASYLHKRISDIEARVSSAPALANEDAIEMVLEVGAELRRTISFAELENKFVAESRIDIEALRAGTNLLSSIPGEDFEATFSDGTPLDVANQLQRLSNLVEGLQSPEQLQELEVLMRLSLIGDGAFDALIMALTRRTQQIDQLESLVRGKLGLLDDAEALELWGQFLGETAESRTTRIEPHPDVVAPAFFDSSTSEVRDRIAQYLTWVRPQLERRQMQRGQTQFPVVSAGVARVLTWTRESAGIQVTTADRVLARSVARLAVWWQSHGKLLALAEAFGIAPDGALLAGRFFDDAKKNATELKTAAALQELRQLVRLAERVSGPDSPALRSLRTYKLGLEAVAADEAEIGPDMPEERLQRHLCRYLVEREIAAAGRVFGRSKSDLHAEDAWGTHVIEAKRFRALPSDATLLAYASQLLAYLDQQPANRSGILVLYNFSDATILTPLTFIRGRLLVLAVNLCAATPSGRRSSLLVEEGQGSDLLQFVRL